MADSHVTWCRKGADSKWLTCAGREHMFLTTSMKEGEGEGVALGYPPAYVSTLENWLPDCLFLTKYFMTSLLHLYLVVWYDYHMTTYTL